MPVDHADTAGRRRIVRAEVEELHVVGAGDDSKAVRQRFTLLLPGIRPALTAVVLLGAGLRFGTLTVQSLWYDEAVSASLVRRSFSSMLRAIPNSESTPPLWYVLEWIWARIFGTSEFALRSFSALCGTLLIVVAFEVTRAFCGREWLAVTVAAVTAVSPIMVWYSQEARAYALYVLTSALSLLFFARARRSGQARTVWLWAVASALALATHYFAGFVIAGEAVLLLIGLGWRRVAAPVALVLATAAALAPLARYQDEHVVAGLSIGEASVEARLRETVIRFVSMFTEPGGTAILIAALAVGGMLIWRARSTRGAQLLLLLAAAELVTPVLLAALGVFDVFNFRNVLAAWLPLVIVMLAGLPRGTVGVVAGVSVSAALLVASIGIAVRVGPQRDSWRTVAELLRELPGRRVVVGERGELRYTLSYYLPALRPLPPAGAVVREIDLVGHVGPDWRLGQRPEFRRVAWTKAGNLTVVRLRSRMPLRVTRVAARRVGSFDARIVR